MAIVGANNWFFVVSYFAALGVGAVVVPLNPGSPPAELERELISTGARVAVVAPSGRESFLGIDRNALALEHVLVPEGVDLPGGTSLEELFSAEPVPVVQREANDLALLVFTAGTAGAPKAAQLTHGNLLSNLEQAHAVNELRMVDGDVVLAVAPPFLMWRALVVANPKFYPKLAARGREKLLGFALEVMEQRRLDPSWAEELFR